MSIVFPVIAFLAFLALLYLSGRWRPRRELYSLRTARAAWWRPPFVHFLAAWLLLALGMLVHSITSLDVWALLVAAAGATLLYAGVRVARNVDGWAEQLANAAWTEQGFRVARPVGTARVMGGGWVVLGAAFVAAAVLGVVLD